MLIISLSMYYHTHQPTSLMELNFEEIILATGRNKTLYDDRRKYVKECKCLHQDFHNCSQALTHSPIPASSLVSKNPLLLRTMFHVILALVWLCLESWLVLWPVPEQWNVAEVKHQSLGHRSPSSFYLVLMEPSCHPPRKLWKHPCEEEVKTLSYSPW